MNIAFLYTQKHEFCLNSIIGLLDILVFGLIAGYCVSLIFPWMVDFRSYLHLCTKYQIFNFPRTITPISIGGQFEFSGRFFPRMSSYKDEKTDVTLKHGLISSKRTLCFHMKPLFQRDFINSILLTWV